MVVGPFTAQAATAMFFAAMSAFAVVASLVRVRKRPLTPRGANCPHCRQCLERSCPNAGRPLGPRRRPDTARIDRAAPALHVEALENQPT